MNRKSVITPPEVYEILFERYGNQYWWPADNPFEIIIGAILTQAAAWSNVEKAINILKKNKLLSPAGLRNVSLAELSRLIYPCGYYNSKAKKVKAFVQFLGESYNDDLQLLLSNETNRLREELLHIYGIGEETADSILLYAGRKPVFVIDAYTRRIYYRLGLTPDNESYKKLQDFITERIPRNVDLYNEYHALLVHHGKKCCKTRPLCGICCLKNRCRRVGVKEQEKAPF